MNVPFAATIALALGALASQAVAQSMLSGPQEQPSELARVVAVTPNLVRVEETRQQCAVETRDVQGTTAAGYAGPILGALAGAALGSRAGKGTGQVIATSAGAAIGADLGARMATGAPRTESVQVCRGVPVTREVVRDYTVRYEWNGREYAALMTAPPAAGFLRIDASHRATAL